jgi:hypothetical protein
LAPNYPLPHFLFIIFESKRKKTSPYWTLPLFLVSRFLQALWTSPCAQILGLEKLQVWSDGGFKFGFNTSTPPPSFSLLLATVTLSYCGYCIAGC